MRSEVKDPIHFIGIGGSGMSGLAELALKRGHRVQGSDLQESSTTSRLRALGATIQFSHSADALGKAGSVVFSSAIDASNVEMLAAKKLGIPVLHRSDFLALLMAASRAITVAGTHGKSTTSAMITHMLDSLGHDPSAVVGGKMLRYDSAMRAGAGDLFVAEADESDGSFLKYRPHIGVVTNIDYDHMEFFKDRTNLESCFKSYLETIDEEGCAIIGWDSPLARQVAGEFGRSRLTYGFVIGSEVRAFDYNVSRGESTFVAIVERDRVPCRLKVIGRHNVQNALCTLAVARALGLDSRQAADSMAEFRGVARRMAIIHETANVTIFDDYAHNPGKIAACVQSLKEAFSGRPLHVVFQAHRFSRLATMYNEILKAVAEADTVHVVPVYSAGESTNDDFSPSRLAKDITSLTGIRSIACVSLEDAVQSVIREISPPTVILTVGASDVWKVADTLKDKIG